MLVVGGGLVVWLEVEGGERVEEVLCCTRSFFVICVQEEIWSIGALAEKRKTSLTVGMLLLFNINQKYKSKQKNGNGDHLVLKMSPKSNTIKLFNPKNLSTKFCKNFMQNSFYLCSKQERYV